MQPFLVREVMSYKTKDDLWESLCANVNKITIILSG